MKALKGKSREQRISFELYKSAICHQVKEKGDIQFIIDTLESNEVRKLYEKKWYPECLYLLAMLDYISNENKLPICMEYNDIRKMKLQKPIYPTSILTMAAVFKKDDVKKEAYRDAIPEFKRFNIIENDVRNVI